MNLEKYHQTALEKAQNILENTLDTVIYRSRSRIQELLHGKSGYQENPFLSDPSSLGYLLFTLHEEWIIIGWNRHTSKDTLQSYELSEKEQEQQGSLHVLHSTIHLPTSTKEQYDNNKTRNNTGVHPELIAQINDYTVGWGFSEKRDIQTIREVIEDPQKKTEIIAKFLKEYQGEERQNHIPLYRKK